VQQVRPIVPTDQLLFQTHWLAGEILLWQRDQSNHELMCGNGLQEIENREGRTLALFPVFVGSKPSRAHSQRITFILLLGGIACRASTGRAIAKPPPSLTNVGFVAVEAGASH
jgi:hypothetical protein